MKKILKVCYMTLMLKSTLRKYPVFKKLKYQGKPIEYFTTMPGFLSLCDSVWKNNLDKIALNHNILRPRLIGYESDLIWEIESESNSKVIKDNITDVLENNYEVIKHEVLSLVTFKKTFPDSDDLTNNQGKWNYTPLFNKSSEPDKLFLECCPKTYEILQKVNLNLVFGFCFVSILEKNTFIKEHCGSTNLRQRYHLGISIPKDSVSRIKIEDQIVNWKDGEAFGFNDALPHSVEHISEEPRIILIVDTWHPAASTKLIDSIKKFPQILNYGKL